MSDDYDKKFAKIMESFAKRKYAARMDIAEMGEQFIRLGEYQKRWIIDGVYDIRMKNAGVDKFHEIIYPAVLRTIEIYIKQKYTENVWINMMDFYKGIASENRETALFEINLIKDDYIALAKYIHYKAEKAKKHLKDRINSTGEDPDYIRFRKKMQDQIDIWSEIQKRNLEDMQDMAKKRFNIEIKLDEITEVQKI